MLAALLPLAFGCGGEGDEPPVVGLRAVVVPVEPNMVQARALHSASPLAEGAVLLAGGIGGDPEIDGTTPSWDESVPLDTLELFDPETEDFCRLPQRFSRARYSHTATVLADGDVLFVGGTGRFGELREADRCRLLEASCPDAACDLSPAGAMSVPRVFHSATRLDVGPRAGSVLIVGGWTAGPPALRLAELYDPATNTITPLLDAEGEPSELVFARAAHGAIALPESGRVLLVGGRGDQAQALATAEVLDPATGRFTRVGDLPTPLIRPAVAPLEGDCVLVVGGHDDEYDPIVDSARFEPCPGTCSCPDGAPGEGRFVPAAPMLLGRRGHTASSLADGRVLVVGGVSSSAELYADGAFSYAGTMLEVRGRHTATRLPPTEELPEGGVLIAGGLVDGTGRALATAEIFDAAAGELRRASGARCSDTGLSAIVGDSVVDCGGLLCRSGRCLTFCETSLDCAPGRVCRADGSCTVPPGDDGGSCTLAPLAPLAPADASHLAGLGLVAALVGLRRRLRETRGSRRTRRSCRSRGR